MDADSIPISGFVQYPHVNFSLRDNPAMDINEVIASNLAAWMAARPDREDIKDVARASGVGFGTVQRAKAGSANLSARNIELIAKCFGRQASDLLSPTGDVYAKPKPNGNGVVYEPFPRYRATYDSDTTKVIDLLQQLNATGRGLVAAYAQGLHDGGLFGRKANGAR